MSVGSSVRGVVVIYRFGEGVAVGERLGFVVCDCCGLLRVLVGRMYSVSVLCGGGGRHGVGDGCLRDD